MMADEGIPVLVSGGAGSSGSHAVHAVRYAGDPLAQIMTGRPACASPAPNIRQRTAKPSFIGIPKDEQVRSGRSLNCSMRIIIAKWSLGRNSQARKAFIRGAVADKF